MKTTPTTPSTENIESIVFSDNRTLKIRNAFLKQRIIFLNEMIAEKNKQIEYCSEVMIEMENENVYQKKNLVDINSLTLN